MKALVACLLFLLVIGLANYPVVVSHQPKSTSTMHYLAPNTNSSFPNVLVSNCNLGTSAVSNAEVESAVDPSTGYIYDEWIGCGGIGFARSIDGGGSFQSAITIPEKMSLEKKNLLKAYGAKVVVTPNVSHSNPNGYLEVAKKIARETPGAVFLDQCNNQANSLSHFKTAQEIYEQMEGKKISALVAGAGTGGTISGCGSELKRLAAGVRVIGVDPEGSVLSGGVDAPYKVEGIGYDFIPGTLWPGVVDEWVRVSDKISFEFARKLAREEGILKVTFIIRPSFQYFLSFGWK